MALCGFFIANNNLSLLVFHAHIIPFLPTPKLPYKRSYSRMATSAEAMAVKSAAEERVENAEPRQICRGPERDAGAGDQTVAI